MKLGKEADKDNESPLPTQQHTLSQCCDPERSLPVSGLEDGRLAVLNMVSVSQIIEPRSEAVSSMNFSIKT